MADDLLINRCQGCGYVLDGIRSDRCPECGRGFQPLEPIAQYREARGELRRTFILGPSRIIVQGRRILGDDYELPIDLSSLDPEALLLRTRGPWLKPGLAFFAISLIFAGGAWLSSAGDDSPWARGTSAAALAIALFLVATGIRKVEYARFRSAARSEAILLDVARCGPDAARFNDFVATLRRQIRAARAPAVASETEIPKTTAP